MGLSTLTPTVATSATAPPSDVTLRLATLADDAREHGSPSAFQAVLVAARCALIDVLEHTATAHTAALSLAQHERLGGMATDLHALTTALDTVLDAPGRCLLDAETTTQPPARRTDRQGRPRLWLWRRPAASNTVQVPPSWSIAVDALLSVLDTQADRLATLASGQPDCAPSRVLADEIVAVLAHYREALRAETRRWAA